MNWRLKTLIILISVTWHFSGTYAVGKQNVTNSADVNHRERFVHDLEVLARLSNGMLIQSELSEKFLNITAQFTRLNVTVLRSLKQLHPLFNQSLTDVTKVTDTVKMLNLTEALPKLAEIKKHIIYMLKIPERFQSEFKKETIDDYLAILTAFKNAGYNYKFMDFTGFQRLDTCITANEAILQNCSDVLSNVTLVTEGIIQQVNGVKHTFELFPLMGNVSNELRVLFPGYSLVRVADLTSRYFDTLSSIGSVLDDATKDLKNVETILMKSFPDLKALDAIKQAELNHFSSLQANLIPAFPHGVIGLSQVFVDLEKKWMQYTISGGKSLTTLKKGLAPLRTYHAHLLKISNKTKTLSSEAPSSFHEFRLLYQRLDGARKWKQNGPWELPKTFVDPIRDCVTNVTKLTNQMNMTHFQELAEYFRVLNEAIFEFMEAVENITDAKTGIVDGLKKVGSIADDLLKTTDLTNMKKLKTTMRKVVRKLKEVNSLDNWRRPFEPAVKFDFAEFSEVFSSHPDLQPLTDAIEHIDGENLRKMYICLSDKQFAYSSRVLEHGTMLVELTRNESSVEKALNYIKMFSDVTDAVSKAENSTIPKNKDTENINMFGRTKDIAVPLVKGIKKLGNIVQVMDNATLFQKAIKFKSTESNEFMKKWTAKGKASVQNMLKELKEFDAFIKANRNNGLGAVGKILEKASKLKGAAVDWKGLGETSNATQEVFRNISDLNLNFAQYARDLDEAAVGVSLMKTFFDDFFGIAPPVKLQITTSQFPVIIVVFVIIGSLLVFLILGCIVYSLTCGRGRFKKYYLEHFASPQTVELYWRYSYWRDQESEKNELCEAVREINYEQVVALVQAGAYINVYNSFGNTPLHAATKYGHAKIVEVLIRNGADRNAYNLENKTAEQLIADGGSLKGNTSTSEMTSKEKKTAEQVNIEKLYRKYKNKTFRQRVPDLLPTMDYRIRVDTRIKNQTVDEFIEVYKGNVTDQVAGVTHLIVPTDKDGVFSSDDFGYIMCVFLPTMLMQEQWMRACLEKKSNFRDDYKFRVEKVRYKGKVFDTVLKWAQWVHKQMLPYLFGVQLHLCADVGDAVSSQLRQLVEMHGATWCEEVPVKEHFNLGSHPFHHFHLGPLFVIHGGNMQPIEHLKNDDMYTLMTFDEFIVFMLQMKVKYDSQRKTPIPVLSAVSAHQQMQEEPSTNLTTNRSSTNLSSVHQ